MERSVRVVEEDELRIVGHQIALLLLTFGNGYQGHILACRDAAFFLEPEAKRYPVWQMRVEDGKVWLTGGGLGSDSVKISNPQGNELAHETVSGWPLVGGP